MNSGIKYSAIIAIALSITAILSLSLRPGGNSNEDLQGKYKYKDFETAKKCRSCHPGIYEQWTQAMMSQAYTHHWDEIEYFDLAVAHGEVDPFFKPVADGCNGCHTPIAFMAGTLPPPRPEENSMANESVSCEVCHLTQSAQTDPPFNFSYMITPGPTK